MISTISGELFCLQLHLRGGHPSLLIETVGRLLQVQGEVREGDGTPAEYHWRGQAQTSDNIGLTFNLTAAGGKRNAYHEQLYRFSCLVGGLIVPHCSSLITVPKLSIENFTEDMTLPTG